MKKWVSVLITFIVVSSLFIFGMLNTYNNELEAQKKYPTVKFEDSIDGYVSNIFIPKEVRVNPDVVRINFKNDLKLTIETTGKSLNHPNLFIVDVCKAGSRIKKEVNSDSVEVVFDNDSYYFMIYDSDY